MIRQANGQDIRRIVEIYERIHDREEQGTMTVGWIRGVYPTRQTAMNALERGDLFVETDGEDIVAAAILNRMQGSEYADCRWKYPAADDQVMVLHTLVVDPEKSGSGYAKAFVRYYEEYALAHGCPCLRMDTNQKNAVARRLYAALGYREAGIVPCTFNGIAGVKLVCLEKMAAQ